MSEIFGVFVGEGVDVDVAIAVKVGEIAVLISADEAQEDISTKTSKPATSNLRLTCTYLCS